MFHVVCLQYQNNTKCFTITKTLNLTSSSSNYSTSGRPLAYPIMNSKMSAHELSNTSLVIKVFTQTDKNINSTYWLIK